MPFQHRAFLGYDQLCSRSERRSPKSYKSKSVPLGAANMLTAGSFFSENPQKDICDQGRSQDFSRGG